MLLYPPPSLDGVCHPHPHLAMGCRIPTSTLVAVCLVPYFLSLSAVLVFLGLLLLYMIHVCMSRHPSTNKSIQVINRPSTRSLAYHSYQGSPKIGSEDLPVHQRQARHPLDLDFALPVAPPPPAPPESHAEPTHRALGSHRYPHRAEPCCSAGARLCRTAGAGSRRLRWRRGRLRRRGRRRCHGPVPGRVWVRCPPGHAHRQRDGSTHAEDLPEAFFRTLVDVAPVSKNKKKKKNFCASFFVLF